jgi:methylphosphotriester-DNA--protein-cysteine methyltransferase
VERVRRAGSPEAVLRAVEQMLLSQLSDSPGRDGSVAAAAAALDRGARVGDVISEFGTTAKPFVRRFTAAVGLTPKRYARVRRLQHLLAGVPVGGPVDWAAAAAQHGFYDQSHLIHDFTEITGVRPTTYRPRGPGEFNHLPC